MTCAWKKIAVTNSKVNMIGLRTAFTISNEVKFSFNSPVPIFTPRYFHSDAVSQCNLENLRLVC